MCRYMYILCKALADSEALLDDTKARLEFRETQRAEYPCLGSSYLLLCYRLSLCSI